MPPEELTWIAQLAGCRHVILVTSVAVPEVESEIYCRPCEKARRVRDVVVKRPERDRAGRI